MNTIIVRYSEIGIKGLNRPFFENKLIKNIKDCLKGIDYKLEKPRGRILIYTKNKCSKLKYVFGIASFSHAIKTDNINKTALKLVKKEKTFRITSKRLDKNFKKTSQKLNEEVGEYILNNKKIKVKLEDPEINIGIEIINNKIYVFKDKIKGLNGLPVNSEGHAYLRVKDKKKSLVAAFLILKRGTSLTLSKKLPLKKFEHGFNIKTGKENDKTIILDETNLKNIKREKNKLILTPLVGLTNHHINGIHKKITEL